MRKKIHSQKEWLHLEYSHYLQTIQIEIKMLLDDTQLTLHTSLEQQDIWRN